MVKALECGNSKIKVPEFDSFWLQFCEKIIFFSGLPDKIRRNSLHFVVVPLSQENCREKNPTFFF